MNYELVIAVEDILMELGAAEWIEDLKNEYEEFSENQLIQLIDTVLEMDTESKPTHAIVGLYENLIPENLPERWFIVHYGNKFKYKELLIAVLTTLTMIDKHKRPSIIVHVARNLLEINQELAERFRVDIGEYVYRKYRKG